ncbi:hypothetical protein BDW66DRAFT_157980 [Aspergillus desertorum]
MAPSYDATTTASELVDHLSAEIKGKVALTTGPSPASIGATFVDSIARGQSALIILAGRNTAKLQGTADAIAQAQPDVKVRLLQLDLGSLASVREAAKEVMSWEDVPRIDVLVNNAGIMATKFALSREGFERILKSESPRVVNVSSDGHRLSPIRWADYNFQEGGTYNKWLAYGQSKTANMLKAVSLAEKLGSKGLLAYSLHPGVILGTSLSGRLENTDEDFAALSALDRILGNAEGWRDFKLKTNQQGAATTVYAAFDPGLRDLQDCHVADPWTDTVKPWGTEKVEAERLWKNMADDISHFQSIPWVSDLLADPSFRTHPIPSRTFKASTGDSLFSTTLNSRSTISSCLLQYLHPPPNITPLYRNGIPTNEVRIFCTLGSDLNGYPGVLHGGIVATLLDECMGLILITSRGDGKPDIKGPVTAYLNTRFVRPVVTPGTVVVSGRIVEAKEERKWQIKGDIKGEDGKRSKMGIRLKNDIKPLLYVPIPRSDQ